MPSRLRTQSRGCGHSAGSARQRDQLHDRQTGRACESASCHPRGDDPMAVARRRVSDGCRCPRRADPRPRRSQPRRRNHQRRVSARHPRRRVSRHSRARWRCPRTARRRRYPGGRVLVFGGASTSVHDAVQEFEPVRASARVIGHLPKVRADVTAAVAGNRVVLAGGFDGIEAQGDVWATADGRTFRIIGRLRQAVRYPAVIAQGSNVYVFGGLISGGRRRTTERSAHWSSACTCRAAARKPSGACRRRWRRRWAPCSTGTSSYLAARPPLVQARRSCALIQRTAEPFMWDTFPSR